MMRAQCDRSIVRAEIRLEDLVREQEDARGKERIPQKSGFHQDRDVAAMIIVEHPAVVLFEIIVDRGDCPEAVDAEAEQRRIVEMTYRVVPDEGPLGEIDTGIADMDGVVSRRVEIQDQ